MRRKTLIFGLVLLIAAVAIRVYASVRSQATAAQRAETQSNPDTSDAIQTADSQTSAVPGPASASSSGAPASTNVQDAPDPYTAERVRIMEERRKKWLEAAEKAGDEPHIQPDTGLPDSIKSQILPPAPPKRERRNEPK